MLRKAFAVSNDRIVGGSLLLTVCCVLVSIWVGISLPAQADHDEGEAVGETIVLGRVSNNPRKHYAALDALGRYIARQSDIFGRHETLLARDNEELIAFMRAGRIDLVSETPFSALLYEQMAGASILLRQWKDGCSTYRTHFFTRKDADIQELGDLAGRLIAFEDPGSTSGYFVPKATIAAHGMPLESANHAVQDDSVRYLFAESEVNAVAWVARGKADAGVVSDINWNDDSRAPPGLKKELRLFHTTPEIVRSVMVAGPRLSETERQDVTAILLAMHESEEGRAVLGEFYETGKFDRLIGDAKAGLDHVRSLFGSLGISGS